MKMGANLYLETEYVRLEEASRIKEHAQGSRTWLEPDEAKEFRKKASEYWDEVWKDIIHNERGFFRDNYNRWCLLWRLDLSWVIDVEEELCTDDFFLPVEGSKKLKALVADRQIPPPQELEEYGNPACGVPSAYKVYASLLKTRELLLEFLQEAIDRDERIYCEF